MPGPRRGRWLALLLSAATIVTGAALAAPVRVLSFSDGSREFLAPLDDGAALTYSYRQSIYEVTVHEDFIRRGDVIELIRVRSADVRSIEYFRWPDGEIVRGADGLWTEAAPANSHRELVLRIAPRGEQRMTAGGWSLDLHDRFGETVVTVRVERRPRVVGLIETPR